MHENAISVKTPLNPKCIFNLASVQKSLMKIKMGLQARNTIAKLMWLIFYWKLSFGEDIRIDYFSWKGPIMTI